MELEQWQMWVLWIMAILQMLSIVVNIESIHKGRTARVNSPTTDAVAIVLSMVFLFALLSILL